MIHKNHTDEIDPKTSGIATWSTDGREHTALITDIFYEGAGAVQFRVVEQSRDGWMVHGTEVNLTAEEAKSLDLLLLADTEGVDLGVLYAMANLYPST